MYERIAIARLSSVTRRSKPHIGVHVGEVVCGSVGVFGRVCVCVCVRVCGDDGVRASGCVCFRVFTHSKLLEPQSIAG